MKNFLRAQKKISINADGIDVQSTPGQINLGADSNPFQIKVDVSIIYGDALLIAGWRTTPVEIHIEVDAESVEKKEIDTARPDVNSHFNLPADQHCGFVFITKHISPNLDTPEVRLSWSANNGRQNISTPLKLQRKSELSATEQSLLGPAFYLLTEKIELNSIGWKDLIAQSPSAKVPCRSARGFLAGAAACDLTRDAVVVGWIVHTPDTRVWLEDQTGRAYSLDHAFRSFRQDVQDSVEKDFGHISHQAGFVLHIPGLKSGAILKLRSISETGLHTLSETTCASLPADPVGTARWLFAINTPSSKLKDRIPIVDEPVLVQLIEQKIAGWDKLPVNQRTLGATPDTPTASVIVPLYGRTDFVEHQMLEFTKDAWLKENAEIIYVVDDPRIVESFSTQTETLFRLYQMPFKWIWGGVNRGFSGANNLGAQHAKGKNLVFLNSDAFPTQTGWVQVMTHALDHNPELGAVGARLLFGDGGMQHAGIEFQRKEELGIWVNHHPLMGLDPILDPHQSLSVLPAVTGACIALRRKDFDQIGGWDTGYLIGDFEDSDLCLKLRSKGFHIGYLPQVELIHLERQSFKLLGQDEFRNRVVIYNALRHQTRWKQLIEQPFDGVLAMTKTLKAP